MCTLFSLLTQYIGMFASFKQGYSSATFLLIACYWAGVGDGKIPSKKATISRMKADLLSGSANVPLSMHVWTLREKWVSNEKLFMSNWAWGKNHKDVQIKRTHSNHMLCTSFSFISARGLLAGGGLSGATLSLSSTGSWRLAGNGLSTDRLPFSYPR